jgi:hypothetical protein
LVFFFISLWLTAFVLTPISSLTKVSGTIARIDSVITRVKNKPFYKQVDKDLRLFLNNQSNFYKVSTSSDFGYITSKIKVGEQITLYTNPAPIDYMSFRMNNRIYHLEYKGETIIDFESHKRSLRLPLIMLYSAAIGFGGYYIYRRRKAAANNSLAKAGRQNMTSATYF